MTELPNSPNGRRNRIGCFVIAAVLALFIAFYVLAGSHGEPGNNASEDIPALPAR